MSVCSHLTVWASAIKPLAYNTSKTAEEYVVSQCKSSNVGCESQAAAEILVCFTTFDGHARSPLLNTCTGGSHLRKAGCVAPIPFPVVIL